MSIASRMPEPGDVLLGRFRVEAIIGQGGMGHVFRATSLSNSGPVAIKVLSPEASTHPEAIPRFINEARATTQLKSPHVVKLFDAGTLDNGLPFIVMELLEGQDLAAVLEQRKSLPVKEAVDYVIQACDAIVEAHARNIVHRDLKPSNLFLSGSARQIPVVKVLDFGISKIISPGGPQNVALTAPNTFLGSPHYMSPEQLKSAKDVDARADIWSLGVILYELIGGRVPFDASAFGDLFIKVVKAEYEPLRVQKPQVPEGIDYVIGRCLQKTRDDRYANLNELVQALAPFASPEGTARAQRMARGAAAVRPNHNPLAATAVLADRPSNLLQAIAQMPPSSGQMLTAAPIGGGGGGAAGPIASPMTASGTGGGHASPQIGGHASPQMPPMPMPTIPGQGHPPAPMPMMPMTPSPGMQTPMPGPMPPPSFGAPPHQMMVGARESSPGGYAAPASQPQMPVGTNAAQQQTIAASSGAQQHTFNAPSGELPRLPPSSPALPLHYAQQNNAANQAPQAGGGGGAWNAKSSANSAAHAPNAPNAANPNRASGPDDQRGASPIIVGLGIGLLVFAMVGVVLIVIALRARGHDAKLPQPEPSISAFTPPPSAVPLEGGGAAAGGSAGSFTDPAPPPETSATPSPSETAAATSAPTPTPSSSASDSPAERPAAPQKTAATPPPPPPPSPPPSPPPQPHNTGSILNKRK